MDGGQLMCCLVLRSLIDENVVNIVQISVIYQGSKNRDWKSLRNLKLHMFKHHTEVFMLLRA